MGASTGTISTTAQLPGVNGDRSVPVSSAPASNKGQAYAEREFHLEEVQVAYWVQESQQLPLIKYLSAISDNRIGVS